MYFAEFCEKSYMNHFEGIISIIYERSEIAYAFRYKKLFTVVQPVLTW